MLKHDRNMLITCKSCQQHANHVNNVLKHANSLLIMLATWLHVICVNSVLKHASDMLKHVNNILNYAKR